MEEFLDKLAKFTLFLLLFIVFPPLGIIYLIYINSNKDTSPTQSTLVDNSYKKNMTTLCYTDPYGYFRFLDSDKLFHRWIMEKELGRELSCDEIVHHKDGDKRNNYPSNLVVCTQEEHDKIHRDNLRKYNSWYEPSTNNQHSNNKKQL